jgi:hypothetical protein
MSTTELLDKTFMELYTMKDNYIFPQTMQERIDIKDANPIMLLDKIHDIGFADKEKNSQRSLGASHDIYNYWINAEGKNFIDNLPLAFLGKPFTYYKEQKDTTNTLSLEKLHLELATLRNEVLDYEETKERAKNSQRWAIVAVVISGLAVIVSLLQWLYK